jgi:hypothetical protein
MNAITPKKAYSKAMKPFKQINNVMYSSSPVPVTGGLSVQIPGLTGKFGGSELATSGFLPSESQVPSAAVKPLSKTLKLLLCLRFCSASRAVKLRPENTFFCFYLVVNYTHLVSQV